MEQGEFRTAWNEFRVGDALGRSFSVWFKNLPAFLVLSIFVYSPVVIYTAVVTSGSLVGAQDELVIYSFVNLGIQFPLSLIMTAAILYGTIQQLRGRHAGIGESIGVGIKRLLPVLGVGFLSVLIQFVWFAPVVASALVAGELAMLLMIPAGIAATICVCMLYVAVPAAVVERPGLVGALRRSRELTRDYRGRIFGLILVVAIITIIIGFLLKSFFDEASMTEHDLKLSIWLNLLVDIVLASLSATISGVVYHDLRAVKDGVGTDDLARVFE